METLLHFINQPLPTAVMVLAAIAILWTKVKEHTEKLDKMQKHCSEQFKWCLDHFSNPKSEGG